MAAPHEGQSPPPGGEQRPSNGTRPEKPYSVEQNPPTPDAIQVDEQLVVAFLADIRNGADFNLVRAGLVRPSSIAALDEAVRRLLGEKP